MKILNRSAFKKIKPWYIIVAVCIAVLIISILIINDRKSASKSQKFSSNLVVPAAGLASAATFTQKLYNAELQTWSQGEQAFITNHQNIFTQSFLSATINYSASNNQPSYANHGGSFLFCSKPLHKPDSYKVTQGVQTASAETALVYVNGIYKGRAEVANLPVSLQAVNGAWAINAVTCTSI